LTLPEFIPIHWINHRQLIMPDLGLSPLPSLRANEESSQFLMEREGFVDEAVVAALRAASASPVRSVGYPEDLALAADDLDFAGWQLSKPTVNRHPEVPPQVIAAIVRRATPPAPIEVGIGNPHHGNHRWWLAGLAGITATLLFAVLLFFLSARPGLHFKTILPPRAITGSQPLPAKQLEAPKVAPELTEASVLQP
jgi:hypothetical protein